VDNERPLTEEELERLRASIEKHVDEHSSEAFYISSAQQQGVLSLFAEIRRLRRGEWIGGAANEITGDPNCCDLQSSDAGAMAEVMRRHLKAEVDRQ